MIFDYKNEKIIASCNHTINEAAIYQIKCEGEIK